MLRYGGEPFSLEGEPMRLLTTVLFSLFCLAACSSAPKPEAAAPETSTEESPAADVDPGATGTDDASECEGCKSSGDRCVVSQGPSGLPSNAPADEPVRTPATKLVDCPERCCSN